MFDRNIHRSRRLTAAHAYLRPALRRPNVDVVSRALATRCCSKDRAPSESSIEGQERPYGPRG